MKCVCAWFPSDILSAYGAFRLRPLKPNVQSVSFSLGHSIVCVCVCDAAVLAGVIWPAHAAQQSSIPSSSLTAVYFITRMFSFLFALRVRLFLPFSLYFLSCKYHSVLTDERENTEVVLAKGELER